MATAVGGVIAWAGASRAASTNPDIVVNRDWGLQAFSGKGDLPFSFVYDGRQSAEFIGGWMSKVKDEKSGSFTRRTLTLTDPQTGLQVKAVARIFTDTAGVDWTLYFTHTGQQASPIIEQVRAVDVTVKPAQPGTVVLHRMKGSTACAGYTTNDFLPFDSPIDFGKKVEIESGSSFAESPFLNLQWPDGGVITAVGWTGQWRASAERTVGDLLRLDAGMKVMKLRLHPGETIRSPRILQVRWSGGDADHAYNLFRQTMIAHIVPRINGQPVTPPFAHTSSGVYETVNSTEPIIMDYLKSVKGLGFEYFWLDAWWFRPKYPEGIGNWGFPLDRVPSPERFPRGLRPISDAVHKEGMKFLVWMGVETVQPGTFLAKEHPEWIVSPNNSGGGLFNLIIPEARKYMTDYINAAIKEYRMDCYRNDSGPSPEHFQFLDQKEKDRVGISEIRYMEAFYRMWDDLLKTNPRLFIDNCCGGGTRIDLETCARSIPLWRTDALVYLLPARPLEAAIEDQKSSASLNRYMPFSTGGIVGSAPYFFRSGLNAGSTFCEDTRPATYPREQLRQAIIEGKRLRKYFFGDMYSLAPINTSPKDWFAIQYHRLDKQDGMILVFRRDQAEAKGFECKSRAIEPAATYQVRISRSYEPESPVEMSGTELGRLSVEIAESPGSLLIEYSKVK